MNKSLDIPNELIVEITPSFFPPTIRLYWIFAGCLWEIHCDNIEFPLDFGENVTLNKVDFSDIGQFPRI